MPSLFTILILLLLNSALQGSDLASSIMEIEKASSPEALLRFLHESNPRFNNSFTLSNPALVEKMKSDAQFAYIPVPVPKGYTKNYMKTTGVYCREENTDETLPMCLNLACL